MVAVAIATVAMVAVTIATVAMVIVVMVTVTMVTVMKATITIENAFPLVKQDIVSVFLSAEMQHFCNRSLRSEF